MVSHGDVELCIFASFFASKADFKFLFLQTVRCRKSVTAMCSSPAISDGSAVICFPSMDLGMHTSSLSSNVLGSGCRALEPHEHEPDY